MTATDSAGRRVRIALAVLAVWIAFFGLQLTVSRSLIRSSTAAPIALDALVKIDLVIAVLWAALSFAVAAWHERVRARARSVVTVVVLHLPLLLVAVLLDTVVSRVASAAATGMPPRVPFWPYLVFYSDFDIVSYIAVVAVAEALLVRRALIARQQSARKLEHSLNRARLDYLETQLQPHFLFNSLGAVSELAYDAPATASRILHQLAAIFRTALARKSDEVTLGEEIVGIEPYLDIQRIRFADWLTIDYQVDDRAVDCLLPRFVLQPLIENAIRHGLSGRTAAGRIDISATVAGGALVVRVVDNGTGLDAGPSSAGRGIGLANVRDRLSILYGDDAEHLRLSNSVGGGAVAELLIPARKRGDPLGSVPGDATVVPIGDPSPLALRVPAMLRRPWAATLAVWFLWGLVWTQQSWVYETLRHLRGDRSWWSIAKNDMTSALVWAALTPIVLGLARRLPIRRGQAAARTLGYLVAGGGVAVAHVALVQRLTARVGPVFAADWQMTLFVDFVIFCILVAVGHRGVLVEWLRARDAAAAALGAEVAAAQARAAKLQSIPPVLLQSLDGIADTARHDAARTERQLTRLADYLRLALECTDERGVTPERERALENAVAGLRDSGACALDVSLSA